MRAAYVYVLSVGCSALLQAPRLVGREGVSVRSSVEDVSGPGRMPVDEGAISAHEFARSANAIPLTAPPDGQDARDGLTSLQEGVLARGATEAAGTFENPGGLDFELEASFGTKYPQTGAFHCVRCNAALYWARAKIGCGCGWPAFYDSVEGAVDERPDLSATYDPSDRFDGARTEIACASCDGHLGHVFRGEKFGTPTDARHCVNGVVLRYDETTPGQPDSLKRMFHLTLAGIPP